ncbi:ROK family protein, partial [Clostridium botulinum]|uniref:ROK family protein n=1 Tax=Clostridium botulinum TaxID=1491 RepID=UPI00217D96ED
MKKYVGLDIGGTSVKYGLVDENGVVSNKDHFETNSDDQKALLNDLTAAVKKIQAIDQDVLGIGVSMPGVVQADGFLTTSGAVKCFTGINLAQLLKERTGLPAKIENDANAATLAEMWLGSLRDVNSGVMLVLGTAVGSGIMINKRLLYGVHQQAGEVSFVSYSKLDKEHMMGSQGSAVALIEDIARNAKLSELDDGRAVFKMINQGNSYAVNRFKIFCQNLASLIYNMQTILDVERFVIGGGISQQSIVVKGINQALCDLRQTSSFVSTTLEAPRVVSSRLYNDANLFGAIS